MVTRKDVAIRAGVSVATVSYVVNHTKNVTPEVRKRVEDAVKELGYRPNLVARSLVAGETYHVAMLVDNLQNPYYSAILGGVQSVANKYGYMVSCILIDFSNFDTILQMMARGVDGYIIMAKEQKRLVESLRDQLCVMMDDVSMILDYSGAMQDAVSSLKRHGHEDIGFLSGLSIAEPQSHSRLVSFYRAMENCGLAVNEKLIIDGNPGQRTDEEAGREAAGRLLAAGEKFSAVIAVNDLMAIGAIREFYSRGLRVPEDISVVGCDNILETSYSIPTISTMDVQSFEQGRLLMMKMICSLKGLPFENKKICAAYIERESVADRRGGET